MSDTKEKTYTDAEIAAKLAALGLEQWRLEDSWLRRKYTTDGWPTTLMLTNAIGYLCEAADHHADLAITWGKLWVKLQTHSAGGGSAEGDTQQIRSRQEMKGPSMSRLHVAVRKTLPLVPMLEGGSRSVV